MTSISYPATITMSTTSSPTTSPLSSPTMPNNSLFLIRPSTSRGTQRLYVRLNTLHYLLSHLQSLVKSLSSFAFLPISTSTSTATSTFTTPATSTSNSPSSDTSSHRSLSRRATPTFFHLACSSVQSAILHVSQVSAYRLIFSDLLAHFYNRLYVYSVSSSRITPCLFMLRQSLSLLVTILTDRAQALAVREVMKAAFEAFLMVVLAGGNTWAFQREDYDMIVEDFENLKRVFSTTGEGLVAEEVVEKEAEAVEGIVALMGTGTETLIEDFTRVACEADGFGMGIGMSGPIGVMVKVPMPPTTGRWNKSDPNTVLRVLCHRNDKVASNFLKKSFQLPRRR